MMKRTTAAATGAIALFLSAIVMPGRIVPTNASLPLDLAGIHAVAVDSRGHVNVVFADKHDPAVGFDASLSGRVRIRRESGTVVVSVEEADAPGDGISAGPITLTLPPGVTRLDVQGSVSLTSDDVLDALEVRATESVYWQGDVRSLRIIDSGGRPPIPESGDSVAINSGEIGRLFIRTCCGKIDLGDKRNLSDTTLVLGPQAEFSMKHATDLDDIRIVDLESGE